MCLGCTIFCITDVSNEEEVDHSFMPNNMNEESGPIYAPPSVPAEAETPKSTWDPTKGEVWADTNADPNTQTSSDQNANTETPTPTPTSTPTSTSTSTSTSTIPEATNVQGESTTPDPPVDLLDTNDTAADTPPTPVETNNNEISAIDELD